jgi:hypothetical protein
MVLSYYKDTIQAAHFEKRKIFKLPNPSLTKEPPLEKKEYWFDPAELN